MSAIVNGLVHATNVPPLSMKHVEANGDPSLFCPDEAGLREIYSAEFKALYEKYEKEVHARKSLSAQRLWYAVLEAQIEIRGPVQITPIVHRFTHVETYHNLTHCLQANSTKRTFALSSCR